MAVQGTTRPQYSDEPVFQQLESYAWDSDTEFQSGLQAILGPNPTPEQAQQLTLRARCFYFSRYATSSSPPQGSLQINVSKFQQE